MTYFAASMFWRAAVHNWSNRSRELAIDLGPYREQLRQYLAAAGEFPKNCMLAIVLPPPSGKLVMHMMHPFLNRTRGCIVYTLLFLGIQFSLLVVPTIATSTFFAIAPLLPSGEWELVSFRESRPA